MKSINTQTKISKRNIITYVFVLLSLFILFICLFTDSLTADAEIDENIQENKVNNNGDLYLSGDFNNWQTKDERYSLTYNDQYKCYCGHVVYEGIGSCEWKIVRGDDWSNSWGGSIDYVEDKTSGLRQGQCVGLIGNKNLNPPVEGHCEFDVKFKILNDNNTIIAVNKIPEFDEVPELTVTLWDENRKVNGHVKESDEQILINEGWAKSEWYNQSANDIVDTWLLEISGKPKSEKEYMDIWDRVEIVPSETKEPMVFTGFKPNIKDELVLLSIQFHAKYELVYKPGPESTLEVFGEFNNWGNPETEGGDPVPGIDMQFDKDNRWYYVELNSETCNYIFEGQFKIRKPLDSRFNKGGKILYIDNNRAIATAESYGDNYIFPSGSINHKVWLTTNGDEFDKVYVDVSPQTELTSLFLKTDDGIQTIKYKLDNNESVETSGTNLYLPLQDCSKVIVEKKETESNIQTCVLKTFDSSEVQTHECSFSYTNQGVNTVVPLNRIRYTTLDNGNVDGFIFYISKLPNNVQINTNYGYVFQHKSENQNGDWETSSFAFLTIHNNPCDLNIVNDISGDYVSIRDNDGHSINIKEALNHAKLTKDNISYDKENGFVFIDYLKNTPNNNDDDLFSNNAAQTSDLNINIIFFILFLLIIGSVIQIYVLNDLITKRQLQ